jgi:ATP-binding cassette, subfamily F, member 3
VLSGGEKVRLALARILLTPSNFLILDEPTTHLDIAAREALEQALDEFRGTLCLVSHDVEFVRHVATGVLTLGPTGLTRYFGGYDYYREKAAAEAAAAATEGPAAPPTVRDERRARKREDALQRQELYRRRRPFEERIAAAEAGVQALEKERETLVRLLSTPERAPDYAGVNRRLGEIQAAIGAATRDWEEASLALEELLESGAAGKDPLPP